MRPNMFKAVVLGVAMFSSSLFAGDLITADSLWYMTTDEYGSVIDTGDQMFADDGSVGGTFTVAKLVGENYPFCELNVESGPLTGVTSIELTYKSEKGLRLALSQKDFGEESGDASSANFEKILPAAAEYTTVTLSIATFKQPDWTEPASKKIGLKLANVEELSFCPNVPDSGGKSAIRIKSLVLKK